MKNKLIYLQVKSLNIWVIRKFLLMKGKKNRKNLKKKLLIKLIQFL